MLLSRFWCGLLAVVVAGALAIGFMAVGEYNRQAAVGFKEGLASDSQVVESAIKLDARRRLDALGASAANPVLAQVFASADTAKDGKAPLRLRLAARKELTGINEGTPVEARNDAVFAVDRDGHVLAEVGYEAAAGNDDFELGGYPAVNDALHGWARADVWMLGSKMYFVAATPADYEVGQAPGGAIVGLKEVTKASVDELAKRTRTNLVLYASTGGVAGGVGVDGFDADKLTAVDSDLKNVVERTYVDHGRSEARMLSEDVGAVYARMPGDAWALGGGFAVVRAKSSLGGLIGVLSHADDKARTNIPWFLLGVLVVFLTLIGVGVSQIEQVVPLRELLRQSDRLKAGPMDSLELTRLAGRYRLVAENVNQGVERASAKAVAAHAPAPKAARAQLPPLAPRESIAPSSAPVAARAPTSAPVVARASRPAPAPIPKRSMPAAPVLVKNNSKEGAQTMTLVANAPRSPNSAGAPSSAPPTGASRKSGPDSETMTAAAPSGSSVGPRPVQNGATDAEIIEATPDDAADSGPSSNEAPDATAVRKAPMDVLFLAASEEHAPDTTTVLPATAELLAEATREVPRQADDDPEWRTTYEEFVRARQECGESTQGLTYEKFAQTLRKSRDTLMASNTCKRVRFVVYVKAGKATLKATPLQA